MIKISKNKNEDIMYIQIMLNYNPELVNGAENAEFYIKDLESRLKGCNDKYLGSNWGIYINDGCASGELYFESPYVTKTEANNVMDIVFGWLKKWFPGEGQAILELASFEYYNRDNQKVIM